MKRNAGPLAESPVTASMCRSSSTTVRPTAWNSRSARARCSGVACAPPASAVMPSRTSAGVLGMARTTGTGAARWRSRIAVLTEATAETRSWLAPSRGPTSRSTGTACCGLTVSSTTSASLTAAALDSPACTPSRRAKSAERAPWAVVTVMSAGSATPASSMPRMSISPSCPAPSTARREPARDPAFVRVRAMTFSPAARRGGPGRDGAAPAAPAGREALTTAGSCSSRRSRGRSSARAGPRAPCA